MTQARTQLNDAVARLAQVQLTITKVQEELEALETQEPLDEEAVEKLEEELDELHEEENKLEVEVDELSDPDFF